MMLREVWPEDIFGSNAMTTQQEVDTLHELFMNSGNISKLGAIAICDRTETDTKTCTRV